MRHTLTAVFDDRDDARLALDALSISGYPDTHIALAPAIPQADFITSVHACHQLTVRTGSRTDVARAADIIRRFIPAAVVAAPPAATHDNARTRHAAYPPGTEPGALQHHTRTDRHYFGTRCEDDAAPLGTTFQETTVFANEWQEASQDIPHALAPPAGETAAYRYGSDMHASDRYRNRSWDEVQHELRRAWQASHPDIPAWRDAEPAMRRGWASTTPEIDEDGFYRTHWNVGYATHEPARSTASLHDRADAGRKELAEQSRIRWAARHPGELTAWAAFKDALFHGWNRIALGTEDDEASCRAHHAGHYGSPGAGYDDLAPAYRFGREMRHEARFAGRDWTDAESDICIEWAGRHGSGGTTAWERTKPAVRYGWDSAHA